MKRYNQGRYIDRDDLIISKIAPPKKFSFIGGN